MALAENIKARRLAQKMSQEELSGLVGVSKVMICKYERGEKLPELYNAIRLARALNTTVEELAFDENNQTAPKQ